MNDLEDFLSEKEIEELEKAREGLPDWFLGKGGEKFSEEDAEKWTSRMEEAIKQARQEAKNEFVDWLKEKDKRDEYATKRQELMMECTHPETHRIYPDHSKVNPYNDDMVWHCTACGYAEFRAVREDEEA